MIAPWLWRAEETHFNPCLEGTGASSQEKGCLWAINSVLCLSFPNVEGTSGRDTGSAGVPPVFDRRNESLPPLAPLAYSVL